MSLLDDVSLMITPNGVAEDVLFGVLPQPIIGTEEITNGDFASDSNWSITNNTGTDSEITGGYLRIKTDGAYTAVSQSGVTVADKQYKLVYTVLSSDGGNLAVVTIGNIASSIPSSVGTHTYYFTSESTSLILKRRSGALDVIIDNVSVREYTSADMDFTRATTATRSAYSVEKITNGDFATDSIWTKGANTTISNGSLNFSSASSDTDQTLATINTTTYKVVFSISNYVSGSVRFRFTGTSNVNGTSRSTNGTFTQYLTATSNNSLFRFAATSFTGSIDSVSVKELLIEEVPRNLLKYSEDLTHSFWNTFNIDAIVASTIPSPDGSSFGFKAIPATGDAKHYIDYDYTLVSVSVGVEVTYSIYVKPFGYTNFQLTPSTGFNSGSFVLYQNFELTGDGVKGTGNVNDATIEKIGDWYRCSITETATDTNPRVLNLALPSSGLGRNPTFEGNSTDGVLLWGGQIEGGASATTYIPTTDRLNVPRIDYTGVGCPHILAEPQRINLVTYSEDFSEWSTEGDIEVTDNFITSPDGTQNAAKLQLTGSSSGTDGKIKFTISPSATTHTFSVFAKKGNHDYIYIWVDISGGTNITRWIDLDDGSVSGSGGTATVTTTSFGNDFWKIEYTFDATNMSNIILEVADDGVSTGTGGDNIYVWGAQLEEGSYATSYIPTSGSTVTRNADVFTRTGIGSLINSAEGVLYVEIAALDDDQTGRKISLNDGTINNSVLIGYTSVSNEIKTKVNSGGSSTANMNFTATDILSYIKIAIKWKVNDFAMWVNGVEVVTDNSGAAPIGLTKLSFDRGNGAENFRGKVRNLQVYKTALSDTQLDDLTS